MRMLDLLTSGVIFAGRRGWGVVAALGLSFGVILALGGSWAEMGLSAFPALSGAGGCADGVCVGWLVARSFGMRRFTDALPGGVSPLSFDGRRNGGALWTAVSDL